MKKSIIICLIIVLSFISSVEILGHSAFLNVEYDECSQVANDNEDDEKWYELIGIDDDTLYNRHLSTDISTIKYYISNVGKDEQNVYWNSTGLTNTQINQLKNDYVEGMKKWNDVYYYSYDGSGNKISNEVINIIEGTADDYNLIIFPSTDTGYNARTAPYFSKPFEIVNNIEHKHHTKWWMEINLLNIFRNNNNVARTGAHEIGHVLGLIDIDKIEKNQHNASYHHEELIMGYDRPRQTEISYQDIAGVSITRGFHTDNDHIWMLRTNTNGTKDVICSLCNGVRYNINTTINSQGKTCYENKEVNIYKSCTHYGGSNSNMLHVATNGVQDFYKCQYCRYIETVEVYDEITIPNPTSISTTDNLSIGETRYIILNVTTSNMYQFNLTANSSIEYKIFDEEFNEVSYYQSGNFKTLLLSGGESYYLRMKFVNSNASGEITTTINQHTHSNVYTWLDYTNHQKTCLCGYSSIEGHAIRNEDYISGNMYATCIICGGIANIGFIEIQNNIVMISDNGSYVLSNGIVVLVDSDIESYLNNTLVFRNPNEDIM